MENQKFKATGTAVEDLTSEEISDALLEIASRVEGRYSPTVLAMNLQREVDLIFKTDPNLGGQLSGEFASCFLSRHPNFWTDSTKLMK